MQYQKVKSVGKVVLTREDPALRAVKASTMRRVSSIVGGTLGPGGHPVLIERFEHDLGPIVTKDGVTVFKNLGFQGAAAHVLMEAMRDVAQRTAAEAGDGTTTATILAESFSRLTEEYLAAHKEASAGKVAREIQALWTDVMAPEIEVNALPADLESEGGRSVLEAVARISANGDAELARAVMACYDICGDKGNVTISESSGHSRIEVERIEGYPLPTGYEMSCSKFYPSFVNDPGVGLCKLEDPVFLLNFGVVVDLQAIMPIMEKLQNGWAGESDGMGRMTNRYVEPHNLVVVATGFSEQVLAGLAHNMAKPDSINVVPLTVPLSQFANGSRYFLDDLAAVTGATVFDKATHPVQSATLEDLGNLQQASDGIYRARGVTSVEIGRYRSTILGQADTDLLLARVRELEPGLKQSASEMDYDYLKERIARLSKGIALLKIFGSSNGELKERRDRAEDAVCAVRGALQSGSIVGGGWGLMRLKSVLPDTPVCKEIVGPALEQPVRTLLSNVGIEGAPDQKVFIDRLSSAAADGDMHTYDCLELDWVDGPATGLLDSVPAVREAVKNAISMATLYGTVGGIIAFPRDNELERSEARETAAYIRDVAQGAALENIADERL